MTKSINHAAPRSGRGRRFHSSPGPSPSLLPGNPILYSQLTLYNTIPITILTRRICPSSDGPRLAQRQLLSHFLVPRAPASLTRAHRIRRPSSQNSVSLGGRSAPSSLSRIIQYTSPGTTLSPYCRALGRPHSLWVETTNRDGQQNSTTADHTSRQPARQSQRPLSAEGT